MQLFWTFSFTFGRHKKRTLFIHAFLSVNRSRWYSNGILSYGLRNFLLVTIIKSTHRIFILTDFYFLLTKVRCRCQGLVTVSVTKLFHQGILLFLSIFLYFEVKYEIIYFMIFQFNSKIRIWFTTRWRAQEASTKPWQILSSTLVGFLSWLSPLVEMKNFIFTVIEFFGHIGQVFGWVWSIFG